MKGMTMEWQNPGPAAKIARLIGAEPYLSADENDAVLLADFAERNAGVLEWHGLGGKVVK